MLSKQAALTTRERAAEAAYLAGLRITKRKTKKPLIVGMVGLVASGKSTVAQKLATSLGAVTVSGDAIRLQLRKHNAQYDHVDIIGEHILLKLMPQGTNVVIDSDFITKKYRDRFKKVAMAVGARFVLIHVTCDIEIALGRAITAKYRNHPDDFFGGAHSAWTHGPTKGAVVKIRELWRRTPLHYTRAHHGPAAWTPKILPFPVFATIDTTNPTAWKRRVDACAKRLLKSS